MPANPAQWLYSVMKREPSREEFLIDSDLDPYRTIGRTSGSQRFGKVNKHGAFSIPRQALDLRSSDQSCHHETWLHLQFVEWSNQWNHEAHYNGNIRLKERPASSGNRAPKRNISEVLSDHSLSS